MNMNINNQNNMMMQNMMLNMNLNNNNFQNQNNINNFNNFNNNNDFFQKKDENIVIVEDLIYKKPSPILIFVFFRSNHSAPLMIQGDIDEKVYELIKRYENLALINGKNFKYVFKEKVLDKNMKVKKAGLVNNSSIFVVPLNEKEKKEINNELSSSNNSQNNDINDEPERKWTLIDIKSSNEKYTIIGNIGNKGNINIFFDITVERTRHILTISTPKNEIFQNVFEVLMKYLNLDFSPSANNWMCIFKNQRIKLFERKTLLEYEIKDLDKIIVIENRGVIGC